jgi:enoyl-CoA hydratase/carnithine racemase
VNRALGKTLPEGIADVEQLYLGELMSTEDAREGLNAFLEKRKPGWKHK